MTRDEGSTQALHVVQRGGNGRGAVGLREQAHIPLNEPPIEDGGDHQDARSGAALTESP